jgi:CheY-like chemotaxis protein
MKAQRRILVVDDNRDAAESLKMLLDLDGHEVHAAHDGERALEIAVTVKPEVMLLDIGMPKVNGYEVAMRVRSEPWGEAVKLVAITGWGHAEDRARARAAGFDHHLVKPVDHEVVQSLLLQMA